MNPVFKQIIIITAFLIISLSFSSCCNNRFNSEEFKNWEENEGTIMDRWKMAEDFTQCNEIIGMTKAEVLELFGEPENKSEAEYRYYLGMSGHGIDTGILVFRFENEIVVEFKLRHG